MVVPVFNQEKSIYQHLQSLIGALQLNAEILLIDDSSWDNSASEILRLIRSITDDKLERLRIKLFRSKKPWFESRCEDFLIRNSEGNFILTIQSDMKILEEGIDVKILELFADNPKVGIISLRQALPIDGSYQDKLSSYPVQMSMSFREILISNLTQRISLFRDKTTEFLSRTDVLTQTQAFHNNQELIFPREEHFNKSRIAGLAGDKLYLIPYEFNKKIAESFETHKGKLWISDYASKPIAFKRETYEKVGGYEIRAFFQGWDDVDFSIKVRKLLNSQVGFSPFYFSSPQHLSSSKKRKKLGQAFNFRFQILIRKRNFRGTHLFKEVFQNSLRSTPLP